MRYLCVLEDRSFALHLTSGTMAKLAPGPNAIQGELEAVWSELEKDHYYRKHLHGEVFFLAESEKQIPWDKMPASVRQAHNAEIANRHEQKEIKKIQDRGQREFREDLSKIAGTG